MKIAGHVFGFGMCTIDGCQRKLVDLLQVTKDDIGKSDIAHVGRLNESEYEEIVRYKERVFQAMRDIASSG